jgi:hypothetical protein
MVNVFMQEKVGSKLAWAIRKVISVGAIRKVISVGAEYRDRLWRVTTHMEAWEGKYQAIVFFNVTDFLKLVYCVANTHTYWLPHCC